MTSAASRRPRRRSPRSTLGAGAFVDPSLPAGYAPFNVQDIGGTVYVAYARPTGTRGDAIDGAGGYLAAFDAQGTFLAQYDPAGLDAPWGIAPAGPTDGAFAGDLLVASTGNGTVAAFAPIAPGTDPAGVPLGRLGILSQRVDGIWGLSAPTDDPMLLVKSPAVDYTAFDGAGRLYPSPSLVNVSSPPSTGIEVAPIVANIADPTEDLTIAHFVDGDGVTDGSAANLLSATIDWGDGSMPTQGILTFDSNGNTGALPIYSIHGTHAYAFPAADSATVTVSYAGGSSYSAAVPVSAVVVDPPIVITPAPAIDPFPPTSGIATAPVAVRLGTFTGPTASYRVAIDWGDGSPPTFGTVVPGLIPSATEAGTSSYTIIGTHAYARAGTYQVNFNLLGPGGLSEWSATSATIAAGLMSLSGDGGSPLGATQGQVLKGVGLAEIEYQYPGPTPPAATEFSARVDWGDGSAATFATVVELPPPPGHGGPPHGIYSVQGSHTYRTPGNYTVTINAIAPDGESQFVTSRVAVAADPAGPADLMASGSRHLTQGLPATGIPLASFDGAPGSYAAVDWGDGSAPTFAIVAPNTTGIGGEFLVAGSHTYARPGRYTASINVIAPNGDSDWVADTLIVDALPGAPTGVTPVAVAGYKGIALTGDLVTFSGNSAAGVGYKAAVDWGDCSVATFATVVGVIIASPPFVPGGPPSPDFAVSGSHTYAASGTYKITVNILAPDGSSSWFATSATIIPPPTAPIGFGPIALVGATSGMPTDLILADFLARQDRTGRRSTGATARRRPSPTSRRTRAARPAAGRRTTSRATRIGGTHTYARPGTYKATINLLGPGGLSLWTSDPVQVSAGSLTLGGGDFFNGAQGHPLTGLALAGVTFFSPAAGPPPSATSYVAAVDWGDGSAATFASVIPAPSGSRFDDVVVGSHTYARPGHYNITVNVIAPDGESAWWAGSSATIAAAAAGSPSDVTPQATLGYAGIALTGDLVKFLASAAVTGDYRAAVDWGDGSVANFATVEPLAIPQVVGPGPIATYPDRGVFGTHTYAAPGTYTIGVNILGPDGSSSWASVTAQVLPPPTAPVELTPIFALPATHGVPVTGLTLATFAAVPGTYSAVIDWGDGSAPSPATIVPDGLASSGGVATDNLTSYRIAGSHTYTRSGSFMASIDLIGPGGTSEWVSAPVTVAPAALVADARRTDDGPPRS